MVPFGCHLSAGRDPSSHIQKVHMCFFFPFHHSPPGHQSFSHLQQHFCSQSCRSSILGVPHVGSHELQHRQKHQGKAMPPLSMCPLKKGYTRHHSGALGKVFSPGLGLETFTFLLPRSRFEPSFFDPKPLCLSLM